MMIRTNLCLEILAPTKEVRGPTLFIRGFAGFFLLLGVFNWWDLDHSVSALQSQSDAVRSQLAGLEADLAKARARSAQRFFKVTRRNAIVKVAKNRLSWGPLLEKLFTVIPSCVELSAVRGSLMETNCSLRISGRSAAQRPRLECDKLRLHLVSTFADAGVSAIGQFVLLEDLEETLDLGDETFPVTRFVIELTWKNLPHG